MADKRIKGITIEIGGDTKKLGEALKDVNKTINTTNSDLKNLQSALKLDPKNTELLAQKQELLQRQIKATTDRLNTLKDAQKQMGDYGSQTTDEQKDNFRELSVEITKTEAKLKDLNDELKKGKSYNLSELNESLSTIREKSEAIVKSLAKVGLAVGGALTTLGVSSIKSYANYEQLVGGVETLFKDSAEEIKKYSQEAYKTSGLSANEYLETVTSFSSSLIQGLGGDTAKSAKYADMAIRDMSDNANKMGTDMSSIQSAYQGFAKQNYTMLDNLKLGYGGTKTEMERLIKDANKVKQANGEMADLSIERFSDMIEAIHIIQDEMGITGTTAKESESTITGSVNTMKASWNNLVLAISDDNADMETAVNNFTDSLITSSKNIVPRIKIAIDGIKKLFDNLVKNVFPRLKREIPELKPLIEGFEWIISHKNIIIAGIKAVIGAFVVTKIIDFATKIHNVVDGLMNFASGGLIQKITIGVGIITGLIGGLSSVFNTETDAQKKAREEMEKHTDILNEHKDSWKNLQDSQQEYYDKSMTELSYYEDLYKELQDITDENGRIKAGYEERANFITSKLSEALGIEIKINDGVIDKNKEVMESIDKLMDKKRAEALLNSQTESYTYAKEHEAEATQNLIYWEDQYKKKKKEVDDAGANGWSIRSKILQSELDTIEKSYHDAENVVNEYQFKITQYESNLEKSHAEKYDEMDYTTWNYVKSYQNSSTAITDALQQNIETTEKQLEILKDAYEKSGDERYKKQIENKQRTLDGYKKELNEYVDAVKDQIPKYTNTFADFIQGGVNGLNLKKNTLFSTIVNIGTTMLQKFKSSLKEQSPSKATREMGQYLIEGMSLGIKDEQRSLFNQVDSFGNTLLETLYGNTIEAMSGLKSSVSTSINPVINPTYATEVNYKLMANAMKEALQDVGVELDDREVGKFIDKSVSEKVYS